MALTFKNPKEYITELIGTMILISIGCTAAVTGNLGVGFAFGLTLIGLVFCIGNVSSCHFNPLISLSMFISGKMDAEDTLWYVLAQIIGGILGAIISLILICQVQNTGNVWVYASMYGSDNGLIEWFGAMVVEFLFAFTLAFVVMKAVDSKKINMKSGTAVALALFALVSIGGWGMTRTAVNPAKSIGTAIAMLFSGVDGKFDPLIQLWLFIIFPVLGAVAGTFLYMVLESGEFDLNKYLSAIKKKKEEKAEEEYAEESEEVSEESAEEPLAEEEAVEEPVEEIPEIESVEDDTLPEVESEEDILPEVESEEKPAEEIVIDSETKTE